MSITSWLSGATQQPQPVATRPVVRRPAPAKAAGEPAPTAPAPTRTFAAPVAGSENRGSPRRPASAVPSITALTLSGAQATLINISATGLLAECKAPLKNGTSVKVALEGTFALPSIEGRVVRTSVVSMTASGLLYCVAISFRASIDLDAGATPQSQPDAIATLVAAADMPAPSLLVNRW
jgi:hypothetical protein